jgi:hypothetical protein
MPRLGSTARLGFEQRALTLQGNAMIDKDHGRTLILRMRAEDVEVFLVARSETGAVLLESLKGWISKKRIADSLIASVTLFAE